MEFARVVGEMPHRFYAVKISKRFVVISKMVDNLVEPLLHAQGYDFYANNYAARFANMAAYAFENVLGKDRLDPLLELYNQFARAPSLEHLNTLKEALLQAAETAPHGAEKFLELMAEGAAKFEQFHDIEHFDDTNDIHVTAVIECMRHWQTLHDGPFDVVHDESLHFFRRSETWSQMTDPDAAPAIIVVGDKELRLPLAVTSTTSARSHECASLQICDLIAGFVAKAEAEDLADEVKAFVAEALAAGMDQIELYRIDYGSDFVDGPPAELDGPDAIDQIRMSVSQAGNRAVED